MSVPPEGANDCVWDHHLSGFPVREVRPLQFAPAALLHGGRKRTRHHAQPVEQQRVNAYWDSSRTANSCTRLKIRARRSSITLASFGVMPTYVAILSASECCSVSLAISSLTRWTASTVSEEFDRSRDSIGEGSRSWARIAPEEQQLTQRIRVSDTLQTPTCASKIWVPIKALKKRQGSMFPRRID
jgi:hypothetical protein